MGTSLIGHIVHVFKSICPILLLAQTSDSLVSKLATVWDVSVSKVVHHLKLEHCYVGQMKGTSACSSSGDDKVLGEVSSQLHV